MHKDAGISDEAGRKTYSIKQNTGALVEPEIVNSSAGNPKTNDGHGKIEIAGVELEANDVAKLGKILEG